jgi:transcriptional regulator with XRE-family HTH domain
MTTKKNPPGKPIPIDRMWFRLALVRAGLRNQSEVARQLGLDKSAFSRTLRGERRLQLDEVKKLASVLGVPQDEVLRHAGGASAKAPMEGFKASTTNVTPASAAPLAGTVDALTGAVRLQDLLPSGSVLALAIRGDEFLEGRRLLIDADLTAPHSAARDMGVLRLEGGRTIVGRFKPGFVPGRFDVGPVLGFGARLDDVAIVGLYELVGMDTKKFS